MGAPFIPRKDSEFDSWVKNFVSGLDTNHERFGIANAEFVGLEAVLKQWQVKYAVTESAATRTPAAIHEKNEVRALLEMLVRQLNNEHLAHNGAVTDTDREIMGLHVAKTGRTRQPAPATIPEYYVDTSLIRHLTIHFRDLGSSGRAKPAGVHGAEIKWVMAETKPESLDELTSSSFDTNTPHTLEFTENQRGKTVWICLRWENTRGEKGPWSEIKSAIIP